MYLFNRCGEVRVMQILGISTMLCCILIIFPVLKDSWHGGRFDDGVLIALIVPLVLSFQLVVVCMAGPYYDLNNSSIFGVLMIFLITSILSFIEVDLVSRTAAIIISIGWGIFIFLFVVVNSQVIFCENIVLSKPMQRLLALVFILLMACFINCFVYDKHSQRQHLWCHATLESLSNSNSNATSFTAFIFVYALINQSHSISTFLCATGQIITKWWININNN